MKAEAAAKAREAERMRRAATRELAHKAALAAKKRVAASKTIDSVEVIDTDEWDGGECALVMGLQVTFGWPTFSSCAKAFSAGRRRGEMFTFEGNRTSANGCDQRHRPCGIRHRCRFGCGRRRRGRSRLDEDFNRGGMPSPLNQKNRL